MLMVGTGQLGAGERIPLWPEGRMPSVCTNQSVAPYVEFFTPEKRTGDAVLVIMPGGGYGGWADAVEGVAVREYFLAKGVPCALLRYRTPRPAGLPRHLTAWQDAQRAVRIVRREAASRGWSPENIGVMGFSAGGHLALMTAVSSQTPAYAPINALDATPCHVNWAVPVYPSYLLATGDFIKGNDLEKDVLRPELAFDSKTPPMCLLHGDEDVISPMGSVRVYHRLRQMVIPAELHIMAGMPHCFFFNCHPDDPAATWKDRVWDWFRQMAIVSIHPRSSIKVPGWKRIVELETPLADDGDFAADAWTRNGLYDIESLKPATAWLKDTYGDFTLDFDYRLEAGAAASVLVRGPEGAVEAELPNLRPDAWSRMTIWIAGDRLTVAADERILRDGALPAGTPAKGRLGIRSKNGKLLMRQIKVKEDAELGNKANRYALNSQPQQGD